jgi:3-phosphoglycerate kinase
LNTINNILPLVDQVLVGGALAYALLKERGTSIGATKLDKEGMDSSKEIISNIINDPKVLLPVDAVIADKFDEHANKEQVSLSGIKDDWMVLDIGSETVRLYTEQIEEAKTVLFFGPPGVFEMEKFADGTKNIIKAMAESSAKTIVGGGDSASAVEMFGYTDKMSLVSTGGGASLTLVQGKELPGLKVLGYYD